MLYRELNHYIEDYFASFNRALLLTGARQTGKTYAARLFGKKFKNFIEINFIEHPEAVNLFSGVTSADEILLRISLFSSTGVKEGETLIFFDEVQCCENIITAIKFLVDDGRYKFILSGSLLGVELQDIKSVPVGYMGIKEVFPLTIEEFFINLGVNKNILNNLRDCYESRKEVDSIINERLLQLFRLYTIVGGMPAAVQSYIDTKDLNKVMTVQKDIVALYKKDISQYADKDKLRIKEIFELIPSELNEKNKRFIIKSLNQHGKFERYKNDFLWLKDAGVAIPVYNVEEPKEPLLLSVQRNLFKLFSNDVGLLTAQYADGIQMRILANDRSINYGSIYENVVAQELLAHELIPLYYNNKRRGEIDFVVSVGGKVLPIEVKSGKDYTRHIALSNILSTLEFKIDEGYVFGNCNLKVEGKIMYLPIYMVSLISQKVNNENIYEIDMGPLL